MEKIKDFEKVEAKGMDDFKGLPIGAYECVIKDAKINHNEITGKNTLKISVDIASGEYKDFFKKSYENDTRIDKKWNNNAVRYLAYEGENVSYFKGFLTIVENSNVGYKWNWEESTLRDKKIVGVFQYEQYEKQDGTKALKVRLTKFRSLDKLGEIKVSDSVKMLDGTYVDYEEYMKKSNANEEEKLRDLFGDAVTDVDVELPF